MGKLCLLNLQFVHQFMHNINRELLSVVRVECVDVFFLAEFVLLLSECRGWVWSVNRLGAYMITEKIVIIILSRSQMAPMETDRRLLSGYCRFNSLIVLHVYLKLYASTQIYSCKRLNLSCGIFLIVSYLLMFHKFVMALLQLQTRVRSSLYQLRKTFLGWEPFFESSPEAKAVNLLPPFQNIRLFKIFKFWEVVLMMEECTSTLFFFFFLQQMNIFNGLLTACLWVLFWWEHWEGKSVEAFLFRNWKKCVRSGDSKYTSAHAYICCCLVRRSRCY